MRFTRARQKNAAIVIGMASLLIVSIYYLVGALSRVISLRHVTSDGVTITPRIIDDVWLYERRTLSLIVTAEKEPLPYRSSYITLVIIECHYHTTYERHWGYATIPLRHIGLPHGWPGHDNDYETTLLRHVLPLLRRRHVVRLKDELRWSYYRRYHYRHTPLVLVTPYTCGSLATHTTLHWLKITRRQA